MKRPYSQIEQGDIEIQEDLYIKRRGDLKVISGISQKEGYITYSQLNRYNIEKHFNNGNTLSIMAEYNYYVPLILDIEHKICHKEHTCAVRKTDLINTSQEICEQIMLFLNVTKKQQNYKQNVYIETRNCGLHIYFKFFVSIVLYQHIIEFLNNNESLSMIYDFDLTQRLPLPKQTKYKKNPYTCMDSKKFDFNCDYSSNCSFYDYIYESKDSQFTNIDEKDIIAQLYFDEVESDESWENQLHQSMPLKIYNTNSITSQQIKPIFLLRNETININMKYQILYEYIEKNKKPTKNIIQDLNIDTSIIDDDILQGIQFVGERIAKQWEYSTINTNFEFIYKLFNDSSNVNFDIYVLCGLCKYLQKTTEKQLDYILKSLYILFQHIDKTSTISNITYEIIKYNIIYHLCDDVFQQFSGIHMLQYISTLTYYNIQQGDNIISATTKVLKNVTESTDMTILMKKIRHQLIPIIYYSINLGNEKDIYIFNQKHFVEHKATSGNREWDLLPVQYIVQTLCSLKLIKQSEKSEYMMLIRLAYTEYVSTLKVMEVKFGKYQHFINTELGVFCTITGTYIRSAPFLQFRGEFQTKKVCVSFDSTQDINSRCLAYYTQYNLNDYFNNLEIQWFRDVLFPGLIDLNNIKHMSTHIIDNITKDAIRKLPTNITTLLPYFKEFKRQITITNHTILNKLTFFMHSCEPDDDDQTINKQLKRYESFQLYIPDTEISTNPKYTSAYIISYIYMILHKHPNIQNNPDDFLDIQNYDIEFHNFHLNTPTINQLNTPKDFIQQIQRDINIMHEYRADVIRDFLQYFSLLYQPKNEHRKFLILIGSTASGKSRFTNNLQTSHGNSLVSILSKLNKADSTNAASPISLSASIAYITLVKEASKISCDLIKCHTGNDTVAMRELYSSPINVDPLAFIIGISNQLPIIDNADTAIKSRVVVFKMEHQFVDIPIENNILMQYYYKQSKKTDQHPTMSKHFMNFLYLCYRYFRNEKSLIDFQLTSTRCNNLIDDFMAKNNNTFKIMKECNIIEHPYLSISHTNLINTISKKLTSKHTIHEFIENLKILFPSAQQFEGSKTVYRGIGLKTSNIQYNQHINVVVTNNKLDQIKKIDLIEILHDLSEQEINKELNIFDKLYKKHYSHHFNLYSGIKLVPQ